MTSHVQTPTFSALSPAAAELLVNLTGECGETVQAASKVLQHGPFSYDPTKPPETVETNQSALERELGDILGVIKMLADAGVVRPDLIELYCDQKIARYPHWAHGELAVRPGGLGNV